MSPEEARRELRSRFKGSVCATKSCWFFGQTQKTEEHYAVSYGFDKSTTCEQVTGKSFEDCFAQIDRIQMDVDAAITQHSILFRKFNLNLTC